MIISYSKFILRWRWACIFISLLAVGLLASGARYLEVATDYKLFFSPGNPQLEAFENLQKTYDKSDNIVFIVTPKDGKLFTRETLESIRWLTERSWQTPYSSRVDSLTNFQYTSSQDDDINVQDLVKNARALSDTELLNIKKIVENEPLLLKRLVNVEANVAAVNVVVQKPNTSIEESPQIATFARALVTELEKLDPNLSVGLTGVVMMDASFGDVALADIQTLVPLMFLLVLITIGLMLRSVAPVFITMSVIIMSILVAMGALGWSGVYLITPVDSAPIIILTVAVADSVHLLSSYVFYLSKGFNRYDAMIESLRNNMAPIFLAASTTIIGFLAMNFTDVPPIAYLGNVVAVGVAAAYILTITFLPALAVMLPINVKKIDGASTSAFDGLVNFISRHYKKIIWSMTLVTVGFVSLIPLNEINDNFVEYFDKSLQFRQDTDYAAEKLIGPYNIDMSVNSGVDNGIASPGYLSKLDEFITYAKSLPEVTHVFAITDTFKSLNKSMHGDASAWYKLPDDQALASQYLLMYEMSLPYGLDLNNQVNVNKSASKLTISTLNLTSSKLMGLENKFSEWFQVNAPSLKVEQASASLMFSHMGQSNVKSQLVGTPVSFALISLILIFALRSVKIGILSLIPNLAPAAIAFGVWALIDGQVGLSVAVVASMTMGIIVDDTIYFLSKYQAAKKNGLSTHDAVKYTYSQVGNALVVTTLVLIIGFSTLLFSHFKLNADLGLMTALTIGIAFALDLLLLPAILFAFDKDRQPAAST